MRRHRNRFARERDGLTVLQISKWMTFAQEAVRAAVEKGLKLPVAAWEEWEFRVPPKTEEREIRVLPQPDRLAEAVVDIAHARGFRHEAVEKYAYKRGVYGRPASPEDNFQSRIVFFVVHVKLNEKQPSGGACRWITIRAIASITGVKGNWDYVKVKVWQCKRWDVESEQRGVFVFSSHGHLDSWDGKKQDVTAPAVVQ